MKHPLKTNLVLFILFSLLAFPLFYFVYKYSSPYLGMIDFFDYYKLYKTMDFRTADSPLNTRLLSSFFVYCMSKTGLVYNTLCQIDSAPFDKVIYFNAVFFNYICVIVTCVMTFHLVKRQGHSLLASFTGGVLYLLGFGTIFFEMMPLADALAVLLFCMFLLYYQKQSHLVLIPLILLIIQREYLLLAIGLMILVDYIKYRNKYYLTALIYCVACFVIHVVLRKTIFETPRYAHHTSVEFMLNSLSVLHFPLGPFIRQTLMTMNIFLIYLAVIAYKRLKGLTFNRYEFLKLGLLMLQLLVLAFLLALGNNAGRYFYMLLPFAIIQLMNELKTFELDKK